MQVFLQEVSILKAAEAKNSSLAADQHAIFLQASSNPPNYPKQSNMFEKYKKSILTGISTIKPCNC